MRDLIDELKYLYEYNIYSYKSAPGEDWRTIKVVSKESEEYFDSFDDNEGKSISVPLHTLLPSLLFAASEIKFSGVALILLNYSWMGDSWAEITFENGKPISIGGPSGGYGFPALWELQRRLA